MGDLAAVAAFLQVLFVDVVLSADNAIVLGLATLGLPFRQRAHALWLGIGLATALRVGFAVIATSLLQILGLLLAGGILLLWVAWKLWREPLAHGDGLQANRAGRPKTLGQALFRIALADIAMSLDNVLAVAAAARDHPIVLVLGISVVLMGAASIVVARAIDRYRWIAYVGLAIIVYIAGTTIWQGFKNLRAAV